MKRELQRGTRQIKDRRQKKDGQEKGAWEIPT
jgi:hypothetical protein